MNVEKVVRQSVQGCLELLFFSRPHSSFDLSFVSGWYSLAEWPNIGGCVSPPPSASKPFTDGRNTTTLEMLISYFTCAELTTESAMRFAGLFLTRERWKAGHRHERQALSQVRGCLDGKKKSSWYNDASSMSRKRNAAVLCSHILPRDPVSSECDFV